MSKPVDMKAVLAAFDKKPGLLDVVKSDDLIALMGMDFGVEKATDWKDEPSKFEHLFSQNFDVDGSKSKLKIGPVKKKKKIKSEFELNLPLSGDIDEKQVERLFIGGPLDGRVLLVWEYSSAHSHVDMEGAGTDLYVPANVTDDYGNSVCFVHSEIQGPIREELIARYAAKPKLWWRRFISKKVTDTEVVHTTYLSEGLFCCAESELEANVYFDSMPGGLAGTYDQWFADMAAGGLLEWEKI